MNQDQLIVLCLKAAEVSGLVTITAFIACYSRWAKWHRNPIGRTIVIKDLLLIIAFIPSLTLGECPVEEAGPIELKPQKRQVTDWWARRMARVNERK